VRTSATVESEGVVLVAAVRACRPGSHRAHGCAEPPRSRMAMALVGAGGHGGRDHGAGGGRGALSGRGYDFPAATPPVRALLLDLLAMALQSLSMNLRY
jgi:hypothetical protein